ncbi:Hypothetical_protein [Hexamita inflata]|uniref:Hypothetical_protein n=1 Tax=Hexamita inflata TaxID=28002 RepID=A0AA86PM78_9EUKA|nr:Hypothetical protein HINF_LOCUS30094 [Hexamita inflata]
MVPDTCCPKSSSFSMLSVSHYFRGFTFQSCFTTIDARWPVAAGSTPHDSISAQPALFATSKRRRLSFWFWRRFIAVVSELRIRLNRFQLAATRHPAAGINSEFDISK